MKKLILLIIPLFLLVGCLPNQEEKNTLNKQSINNPTFVATLPDGRNLYCIEIIPLDDYHTHYVYYFGTNDTRTVNVNYAVSAGKTSYNQTIVLDGKTYQLIPKP